MDLLVAIPTYWSRPGNWQPGDGVYDHPTPLDQDGTLGRTLESLARLEDRGDMEVVVVTAATAPDLAEPARRRVAQIIEDSHPAVPVSLFCQRHVDELRRRLKSEDQADLQDVLSLDGYSNIRNVCLALGQLMNAPAVVQIDDDEVFDDPRFLRRVRRGLDGGARGLAGYYVDGGGGYLLPEPQDAWQQRLGKVAAMNEAFRRHIGASPRLRPTPFAFGGNMTITQELYAEVPFDPAVPRGEDVDYVINAGLDGHRFLLDNRLAITHLPVPHSHPAWRQLRQDVERFAYERDKLAAAGVDPGTYDPYPGPFLGQDLVPRVEAACELLVGQYRADGDENSAEQTEQLAVGARAMAFPDALKRYRSFQRRWQALMRELERMRPFGPNRDDGR